MNVKVLFIFIFQKNTVIWFHIEILLLLLLNFIF